MSNSKFLNNKLQLDAYQKNWRYGDGGKIEVDNSKAKKLLKWKPKYSLDEGLEITASYYDPKSK